MTILIPYCISLLIGCLTLHLVLRDTKILTPPLFLSLGFGLGLGLSSILTFFSFLIFSGYHQLTVIGINLILVFILIYFAMKQTTCHKTLNLRDYLNPNRLLNGLNLSTLLLGLGWMIIAGALYFLFLRYPYGGWDAWALYNTKTKFLIFNGPAWTAIFDQLHPYTQPDYPLLLPFMNTWIYAASQQELHHVTFFTAFTLTLNCGFLLFAGLKQLARPAIAILASFILLLIPHFILMGSSQYADVLLAFNILAVIILTTLLLHTKNKNIAILTGLFMGLLTFTKNEGIVITLLLSSFITLYFMLPSNRKTHPRGLFRLPIGLLIGLCATASATVIFKLCLAPPNPDILPSMDLQNFTFLNGHGLSITLCAIVKEFIYLKWGFVWGLIGLLVFLKLPRFFYKENKVISLFFIAYFSVLILIYLTTVNFDLAWRLRSTLSRIYFYLLPSILFFCCYINFMRSKND